MSVETETLVVGGGSTGVGVARDLAMRGVDVVLAERGGLSAGATGRSHGVLHSGVRYAESDPAGGEECIDENRTLREIAGVCVADTGGYFLSLSDDDGDYFERKLAAAREVGIDAEEVSPAAVNADVPGVTDDVSRAMRVPDGVVYPSRLVAATAADARERGAEIRTGAPVEDVHVEGGRVTGATVDGERVSAEAVVNAAGAWAGECAALAGVEVRMRPTKGAMVGVVYDGLGAVLNRCRDPADGDIAVPHRGRAVLGTTSVAVDDPDEFAEESWEVERVVAECAEMVPAFADADVESTYWGVRPLYEPDEERRTGARGPRTDDGDTGDGVDTDAAGGGGASATGDERGISRGFALLDHGRDGVSGFYSIVGGKLTTHRAMAEAVADRVCADLGVDEPCRTAAVPLVGSADPETVDGFVREFDARSPADADVVGE